MTIGRRTHGEAIGSDAKATKLARILAAHLPDGVTADDIHISVTTEIWAETMHRAGVTEASDETRGLAVGKVAGHLREQTRTGSR